MGQSFCAEGDPNCEVTWFLREIVSNDAKVQCYIALTLHNFLIHIYITLLYSEAS